MICGNNTVGFLIILFIIEVDHVICWGERDLKKFLRGVIMTERLRHSDKPTKSSLNP